MTDESNKPPAGVPLSKSGGAARPAPASAKPRQVQIAVWALVATAVFTVVTALGLLGQRDWLRTEQGKANASAVASAVSSATSSAAKHTKDVPSASASASSSAAKKYPVGGKKLDDQISTQIQGVMISSLLVIAVLGFLAYGVYRGRHWSRWGVTGFWILASFTGTGVGLLNGLQAVISSAPLVVRIPTLLASLGMIFVVVLVNMRPSVEFFALSRPAPRPGAPQRRGLFGGPRPQGGGGLFGGSRPQGGGRPGAPGRPAATGRQERTGKSPITSSAADRGEKYVERQRAKKRANADSVARGAELARSRAKASKSRRPER